MDLAEQVHAVVRLIPPGRVVSYGDIAALLGIGPRQVGQIMAKGATDLPWWRVTSASGDPPRHLREAACAHFAEEGMEVKRNGLGVSIARYRADLPQWADDAEATLGPLPR
ncbi:MGMT family protein [Janibacter sp. GXQ6167]|uniref:MGMT family protein n=1 Tax=Janibacter sp. GXQ6167 TaxID=3240791 RepID=UPI003525BE23